MKWEYGQKCVNPFYCQCCPHIETSQLLCSANQLTGFYRKATLAIIGLILQKIIALHICIFQSLNLQGEGASLNIRNSVKSSACMIFRNVWSLKKKKKKNCQHHHLLRVGDFMYLLSRVLGAIALKIFKTSNFFYSNFIGV